MLTKADDYPIHQLSLPVATPATSDRNFYDRYYFNGYSRDGKTYFVLTLGVYPTINLIDAAFMVQRDGQQRSIFASRHLNCERLDSRVAPIEVKVLEPLHKLMACVEKNQYGISAELVATGRTALFDEGRMTQSFGPRVLMDATRATQNVDWQGWIELDGEHIDVQGWIGSRDRSWGFRPLGVRDPQPSAPMAEPQLHWLWGPLHFDDYCFYFHNMDNADGESWHRACTLVPANGKPLKIQDVDIHLTYRRGTRQISSAELNGRFADGGKVRIEYFPREVVYMQGAGYNHPIWGQGTYHGEYAVHYQTLDVRDVDPNSIEHIHVQHLSRAVLRLPDGSIREGRGILEQIVIGRHAPSGFKEFFDVAA